MLRLSLRTLSSSLTPSRYLPPYSISIARCSTSPPPHLTHTHSHGDPDPRNVRVSVWWDLDKCYVPSGVNVSRGVEAITAAIESSGIKGPIQITAFGDMMRLSRTNQQALSSTASTAIKISHSHIPPDGDCSARSSLFDGLMDWVSQNPPPAHLFLIIADEGSSCNLHRLHQLRMNKYNILLAIKEPDPAVQWSPATIMWNWGDLVTGENLTGRHFNQPPNDSWYGHYERPLEDPCTEIERPALQHEVFSHDSFWRDLQTFINTDIGSFIIAEVRTREEMAFHLQVYGPSVLKYVTKSDLFLLVDKLTSEEKWVLESPYLKRPLKLRINCDSENELVYSDASYSDVLCFLVLLCFLMV